MFVRLPMNRRTGGGKFNDERRGRDDLVLARQPGLLIDVNHFQVAVAFQFGFAQFTDAQDGLARSGRGPRHEQSQDVFARRPGGQGLLKGLGFARGGLACFHGRSSRSISRAQIQAHEHALGVGKVANDGSHGLRQLAHHAWEWPGFGRLWQAGAASPNQSP